MIARYLGLLFGLEERRQTLDGIDAVMDAPKCRFPDVWAGIPRPRKRRADCRILVRPHKPALRDVHFTVPSSSMLAIVGPSGCGW